MDPKLMPVGICHGVLTFGLFWKLLETVLGVSLASSMAGPARKKWFFCHPEGCSRATLLSRTVWRQIWKPFGCFWKAPEQPLASFIREFFGSLVRAYSIYIPDMYISSAYHICMSDKHIRHDQTCISNMQVLYAYRIYIIAFAMGPTRTSCCLVVFS